MVDSGLQNSSSTRVREVQCEISSGYPCGGPIHTAPCAAIDCTRREVVWCGGGKEGKEKIRVEGGDAIIVSTRDYAVWKGLKEPTTSGHTSDVVRVCVCRYIGCAKPYDCPAASQCLVFEGVHKPSLSLDGSGVYCFC